MTFDYFWYQIDITEDGVNARFMSLEIQRQYKKSVTAMKHYIQSYSGSIEAENSDFALEALYDKFNNDYPADFTGHSMSVSDIVVLYDPETGKAVAYYCDSVGFALLNVEESRTFWKGHQKEMPK